MTYELELDRALEEYRRYLEVKQGLHEKTVNQHARMVRKYLEFAEDIEPPTNRALDFKEKMMQDDLTAVHINNTMKGLEYYYDSRDIDFEFTALKRARKIPDRLTKAEIEQLLRACKKYRDHAIVLTLASTGVRASELVSLDVGDIKPAENLVLVRDGKDGNDGYTRISDDALQSIDKYLDTREGREGPLFLTRGGGRFTRHGIYSLVNRLGDRAGLEKVNINMFRHYFATSLIRNGADIAIVKELMRHNSIRSTERYVTPSEDTLDRGYEDYRDQIGTMPSYDID